jgi:tetratricopeptide (TPR) repeat protein
LIEVESGRLVYANNVSGAATASQCEDSSTPMQSQDELIGQAKQLAKAMFRTDVAPHYIQVEIKLIEDKDGIASKEAENKFEQGMDFAKKSRLDRACELWGEARTLAQNSKAILYSLGICAEVTGDPENALDLYKKADRLLLSPDDRVSAAIQRVSEAVQKKRKLKEQMGQ